MTVFLNKKLRKLRKRNQMTQADVAEAIGADSRAISRWELAKETPSDQMVDKLCTLFNVARESLMEERKDPVDPLLKDIEDLATKLSVINRKRAHYYLTDLLAIQTGEQKLNVEESLVRAQAKKVTGGIFCNFCGKPQNLCDLMIAGNNSYICNECVRICTSIIEEKQAPQG